MAENTEQQFWYNSRTGVVEQGMLSASFDRVGPFETREEAENAPQKLRENARRWAEEDAEEAD